jgi:hypothetical protein
VSTRSTGSSHNFGGAKKKAADFYFQKGGKDAANKPAPARHADIMMAREISPLAKKKSTLERKSTNSYKKGDESPFTYDRPTKSFVNKGPASHGGGGSPGL